MNERLASAGQQKYIADLIKDRCGDAQTVGEIEDRDGGKPVCMTAVPDTLAVNQWVEVLTFAMAKEALTWLVTLPEPERAKPAEGSEITPAQRSKCWAILKALGSNTYRAWLLRKDDPDIPHLRFDDANTTVWDWLSGLSVGEAVEVIEHLEAVQKIVRR